MIHMFNNSIRPPKDVIKIGMTLDKSSTPLSNIKDFFVSINDLTSCAENNKVHNTGWV